jgi:hypothetical protein
MLRAVWSGFTRPLTGRAARVLLAVSLVSVLIVGCAVAVFTLREQRTWDSFLAASSPPPTITCHIGTWCRLPPRSDASPGGGSIKVSQVEMQSDTSASGRIAVTIDVCAGSIAYMRLKGRPIFLTADATGAVVGPAPIVTGLPNGASLSPGQCRQFQESFANSEELAPVYLDGFFSSETVYRWRLATSA